MPAYAAAGLGFAPGQIIRRATQAKEGIRRASGRLQDGELPFNGPGEIARRGARDLENFRRAMHGRQECLSIFRRPGVRIIDGFKSGQPHAVGRHIADKTGPAHRHVGYGGADIRKGAQGEPGPAVGQQALIPHLH